AEMQLREHVEDVGCLSKGRRLASRFICYAGWLQESRRGGIINPFRGGHVYRNEAACWVRPNFLQFPCGKLEEIGVVFLRKRISIDMATPKGVLEVIAFGEPLLASQIERANTGRGG